MHIDVHIMCLISLPDFNETRNFSTNFEEVHKYQIS